MRRRECEKVDERAQQCELDTHAMPRTDSSATKMTPKRRYGNGQGSERCSRAQLDRNRLEGRAKRDRTEL